MHNILKLFVMATLKCIISSLSLSRAHTWDCYVRDKSVALAAKFENSSSLCSTVDVEAYSEECCYFVTSVGPSGINSGLIYSASTPHSAMSIAA